MQQQDLAAIGSRIQYIRNKHKYTYVELAEKSGLHFNTVSNVEKGKVRPPQKLLDYLNKEHGYNADWILYSKGRETGKIADKESKASLHAKIFDMEKEIAELKGLVQQILAKLDND
jgi:transcriptional regulator with XRE-family HTH domain